MTESTAARAVARHGAAALLVLCALAGVRPALAQSSPSAGGAEGTQAVAGVAALAGNGLTFDGSTGRVMVEANAFVSLPSSFTVEFWARRAQTGREDRMVSHGSTNINSPGFLHIGFRQSNTFAFSYWNNALETPAYTDLNWHHWAVSYDGATRARRIYRDGNLVASGTGNAAYEGAGTLRFGDLSLLGTLDEVRIWNTVRTAQQVRDSRNLVLSPASPGLVGYWDFETTSVNTSGETTVRDLSATGATGVVSGGVTLAPSGYATPSVRGTYDLYEDRVVLTWDRAASPTARHQIRRDDLLIATLSASDTTYTDRAGVAGRAYPYCVTRIDGATSTNLGCEVGRRQLLPATNVAASDGLYIDRVRLTWSDRSLVNTGYRVYRAGTLVATLGDVDAFEDTTKAALTPGIAYAFCVAPIQGAGEGAQVCDPGTRGSVLPAAAVRASDGTQPVSTLLTWADQGTGATGFTITRNGAPLATVGGALRQYRDVTGAAGTVYTYCVVRQQGATSAAPTCDAGGQGTMLAPQGVAASDSSRDDRVEVRWSNSASTETGYRIHREGGRGLAFDGANDHVTAASFTQSPASGTLTIEAWVRPDAFGGGIVTKGVTSTPWSLKTLPDGRLAATLVTADGTVQANSTHQLALGVWQHVAVTMGDGGVRFYLDGVDGAGAAPGIPTFPANDEPLVIGADLPGADAFWTGGIDEVRVWSVVRSQAEIRAAMHAAARGDEDGLMALYHFDEGIGTLATDVRSGRHGVLQGFDGTGTSGWANASAPVAGHSVRPALRLDGTDDHATVSGFALSSSFTVEFWARRDALGRADVAVGHGTNTPNAGLDVGFGADNRFSLSFGGNDLASPAAFLDLDWHHWAVTYDRTSGQRTIVRDGVELTRDVSAVAYAGSGTFSIGKSIAGGTFGGRLADVRVWSRVRPAAAIAAGRYALADSARTGLVGQWRFDALDASGTGAMTSAPGGSAPNAVLAAGAALTGAGRPHLLGLVPAGSTSVSDLTPEPGLRYTYCVQAFAAEGAETPAVCDDGSRARAVAPPAVVASDGIYEDRVTVAWLGASTRAVLYNVYRGSTLLATLPAGRTSFEDVSGAPTTVYTYCVAALTADETESVRACDAGSRVLKAPTVAATDDTREDRVDVTWTDNSGAETGYRVTRQAEKNHALVLPATDRSTQIPYSAPYAFAGGAFTIEFWINPSQLGGDRIFLVRTPDNTFTSGTLLLGFRGNVFYPQVFDSNGAHQLLTSGTVPTGQWSHVALTYQTNGALVAYVNGAEVGRRTGTGASFGAQALPLRFGINGGGFGPHVAASVDELRVWNTARTAAEIQANMNRQAAAGAPGLVGLYGFDEGVGELTADGAGGGSHIALGGATWAERTGSALAPALVAETAASATAYVDRTAASGVRYTYAVTPFDALGAGVAVEDAGRRVQKAPTGLAVTSAPNETQIALAWTDNSTSETRQRLVRRAGSDVAVFELDRNVVSYVDASVVAGTEYRYSIASGNLYGVSSPSETVSGQTILLPAASVSASDTYTANVVVQWVDASAFETGYRVYRDGMLLTTTAAGAVTYTDATATVGTVYTYCVATLRGTAEAARVCDPGTRPSSALPATTPLDRLTNQLTPASIVSGDHFGKQVAVQGDYAIVGIPYKYASGRGAVAFLKRSATGWDVLSITPESLDCPAGELGWDVTIDGQYAAAGCWNDRQTVNGTLFTGMGSVFVFRREGDDWFQAQKILSPTPTTDEYFGVSVELEGDHLLVGTRKDRVYAYRRSAGTWTHTGTLTPSGAVGASTKFGERLALSGTTALIGSPNDSQQTGNSGAAYVFTRGGDTWTQQAKLLVSDGVNGTGNFVGDAVDLLGDVALVGASGVTIDGLRQGAAYLFKRTGTTWAQVSRLTAATPEYNTYFATDVALTEDYVLLGSLRSSNLAPEHGLAYLYSRTGDTYGTCQGGACVETKRIGPQTVGSTRESFGSAVAGDAESFIVGAQYLGGSNQGSVFPFEMSARPTSVKASDGSYASRVQVTWEDRGNHEESFRIYRNGQKVGEVSANVRTFDDFDALPGDLATYCVSSYRQAAGESGQACDLGWRPADGRITGRVAASSASGTTGAGVADVNVCLAPPPNRALLLDGTGAFARSQAVTLGGDEITVEYWFKGTSMQSVVRQQGVGGHVVVGHAGGRHLLSNEPTGVSIGAGATDGQWHHVAMTWKRNTAGGFRSYLDGVLVEARTASNVAVPNISAPLYVGALEGTGEFARGQIDEVRVWRRARTQAELQAAMRTPLSGTEDGLAVYLPFDQGAGPAALDMTASAAHAVFGGGAAWSDQAAPLTTCATTDASGVFSIEGVRYGTGQTFALEASKPGRPANTALAFDGTASAVRAANVTTAGDELTIAYWFKGSSLQSAVRQQGGSNFLVAGWNGLHVLSNDGGTAAGISVGAAATDGQWHHVAMTWKKGAANGFVSYLDGDLVAQRTASTTAIPAIGGDVFVGSNAGTSEFTNGQVDEVRVWQRALTQAELRAEMAAAAPAPDRLVLSLPFSEGSGTATRDASRLGATATISGSATWATRALGTPNHVFQPAVQAVALSAASPVQNSVAFTDVSTYSVAGKVRYNTTSPRTGLSYGVCGVPGATVSAAGVPPATADDSGDFSLALQPGRHTLGVAFSGLAFTPETITLDLAGDVAGQDFVAGPLRRFILRTETAGGFAIGTHTARIRSEDGCYDRTVTTDAGGAFLDELPPLKYTVQVTGTVLTPNTGLDQVDVDRYFAGLGAQLIDLTEKSDTLAMAYRAPLKIVLTGLPSTSGPGAQTCAAPDKLGVPTLAQGLLYPLFYEIIEDFGALGSFPAQDVRVQIVDEIADESAAPLDTTVAVGNVLLQTAVGQPNVLAGRVVDGVDRSYQKSIQITATAGARTATRTDWAVVTGEKARNGSFVSLTTNPVPLYVLRDPPGDASYSYLEKGSGYCFTLADWSTSSSLGKVSNFSSLIGPHAAFGIGVAIESRVGVGPQASGAVNMTWRREGNTQICLEAKERFATSADPAFVGENADVFIGAAFNMLYAQTDNVKVNGATCSIETGTGYGIAPDPTKPISSAYAYSAQHIRDVLIPQIQSLKANAAPTDTTRYDTYLANWQHHLDYNARLRRPDTTSVGLAEQKAFSGGAEYAASFTSDSTYYHKWSTHMFTEAGIGLSNIIKTPANEFQGGWILKFTRETTFELPGFMGAPPFNGQQSLNQRRTTGYVLADNDAGDSYAVNVRPEQAEEVSVYVPSRRTDDVALSFGLTTGGTLASKLITSLVTQFGKMALQRSNIVTGMTGASIDFAFGLSQGLYDLGALLNPQSVVDAEVETRMRVPFGSPVFDLVAGTSSCPWLPDATFSASGGAQRGTLRRDLPTLAINRTSLVNADPSKAAVFSLFLGNSSESNETRRYVLRAVNERNPGGATLKINGVALGAGGMLFAIPAGRQIEATLSVERGPTRFRYDSLQVLLAPECPGLDPTIAEREAATQTFSVSFKSVSSPITLYTSPRFDFDFGQIADASPGDSVALADFTLETIDFGDASTDADDVYLTEIGMEYRAATSAVWKPAFAATRAQIIAASPQSSSATTYYTRWKPASSDVDGLYQFRAYTRSTGGGPSGAVYYGDVVSGRIDRKAPLVFGTPQPSDEVLSLGDDVVLTFDEAIAPASVLADSATSATSAANLHLVYADSAESGQRIRVRSVVSGASVVITPVAGWAALEGRTLTAELRVGTGITPLTDVLGNALASGQTWSFVVRRSVLAWSAPTLRTDITRGVAPRVTVNLANGRTTAADFTLSGVPAWLTPSVVSGTIAPGAVQPVTFTGADTLSGGTHAATITATIGSTTLPLALTVTVDAMPTWVVDASRFQHSMAVTAQLFLQGRPSTDAADLVGAFVGGELRGVASVTPRTSSGQTSPDSNRVSLVVYSNAASGEVVTFKVWDADATSPVLYSATSRSIAFFADAIEGTPSRPLALHAPFVPGASSVALNGGWTWVSFPRVPESATIKSVLSPFFGVSATSGDVVKSQRSFAMFSGTGGSGAWMGPLADSAADVRQSYMVRLSSSQELMLSFGGAVADTMGSIPLSAGWNWIGFARSVAQPLSHALAGTSFSTAPAVNDLIKSQTAFAQYVPGLGWVGSLTMLEPGRGYMMRRAEAGTLAYPAAAPTAAAQAPDVATSEASISEAALSSSGTASATPSWSVEPGNYQFNMTAIVSLEDASVAAGALVGAFSGDSLRGVATLRAVPGVSRAVAFLMVYGHRASGESLSFRVYDPATSQTRPLSTVQAFTADAMLGSLVAPFVLRATATSSEAEAMPSVFSAQDPAPNPFGAQATFRYALPSAEHVSVEVYDVMGRRVARLVDARQEAGRYAVEIDGRDLASGVYVVRLRAGAYSHAAQIVRVR